MTLPYDQPYDKDNVPKRWAYPHYGDGLLTTGDGTEGNRYGYCFQPHVFQKSGSAGFYTSSWFTPHGFNPELQSPSPYSKVNYGVHPYFAKAEDAVKWLKDCNLTGEVMRYAHHKSVEARVPEWKFQSIVREWRWEEYRPWLTAGVTDVVTETVDVAPTTILGLAAGFQVHNPDGTSHPVGGATEESWSIPGFALKDEADKALEAEEKDPLVQQLREARKYNEHGLRESD